MLAKQDTKKSWGAKKSGPPEGGPSGTPCLPLPTSEFLSPTPRSPHLPKHPMPISCPPPPLSTWTGNYLLFFWSSTSEIQTTAKTNLLLIVISRPPFLQNRHIIAQVNCKWLFLWAWVPAPLHPAAGSPASHQSSTGSSLGRLRKELVQAFKLLLHTQDYLRVLTHLFWSGLKIEGKPCVLRARWFPSNCHKPRLLRS